MVKVHPKAGRLEAMRHRGVEGCKGAWEGRRGAHAGNLVRQASEDVTGFTGELGLYGMGKWEDTERF